VQDFGRVTINLDASQAYVAGDNICTSATTAGKGHANGTTACTTAYVGIAAASATATTVDAVLGIHPAGTPNALYPAAGLQSTGTTFTATGCGTPTSLSGGASAGQFVANSSTCVVVVTMGNSLTAAHGWFCSASDETTLAATFKQTAHTTTSCTLTGTSVVASDVVVFGSEAY
jgi:hypothetical protein